MPDETPSNGYVLAKRNWQIIIWALEGLVAVLGGTLIAILISDLGNIHSKLDNIENDVTDARINIARISERMGIIPYDSRAQVVKPVKDFTCSSDDVASHFALLDD